jgi:hypothetical protein
VGHTPKPLVQVWRAEHGKWLYDCRRCHEQLFDRTWPAIYKDAREHAASHTGVGFSRKG